MAREYADPIALRAEIADFAAKHGVGLTFVGVQCLNDASFYRRLGVERRVTTATADKVRAWMAGFRGVAHDRRTCEKPLAERVRLGSVEVLSDIGTPCWQWTGKTNARGYGVCWNLGKEVLVHRAMHEAHAGPIPAGAVVDHICRNKLCANPAHLQAISNRKNIQLGFIRRGVGVAASDTHCIHGHEMTPANTVLRGGKTAECRTCAERRWTASNRKRRAA